MHLSCLFYGIFYSCALAFHFASWLNTVYVHIFIVGIFHECKIWSNEEITVIHQYFCWSENCIILYFDIRRAIWDYYFGDLEPIAKMGQIPPKNLLYNICYGLNTVKFIYNHKLLDSLHERTWNKNQNLNFYSFLILL